MRNTKKGDNDMRIRSEMTMLLTVLGALALSACGGDDQGNLSVLLEAEESIVEGLEAGDGDENIVDGFNVTFSRYVVAIGYVAMSQVDDANPQSSPVVAIADFKSLGTLPELTSFNGIPTGQYTNFGFETPVPSADVVNFNDVDEGDIEAMIENEWSYIIEGTIEQVSDGETKDFLIQANVPSVYSDCAVEDRARGVNVQSDSSVDITLHGDHIFFNGFPDDEDEVQRRAKWMWDVRNIDSDPVLTRADFEAETNIGKLFPQPPDGDYQLGGGPLEITNAWDFIRAQLGTQGHIFGEGECEWSDL